MRIKRVEKFKRLRYKKLRNTFVYLLFLPTTLIFMGYLLSSVLILPAMKK